jgi:anti-anti-sigma regulatory factor
VGVADNPGSYWTAEGYLIEDLFATAIGEGPVYADKHLVVTRTEKPPGFRFAGEIDMTNSDAVMRSVRLGLADAGNPHLDLSRLSFCDISGIRGLVDVAIDLAEGRSMLLHGLPTQLQTVMRATGWSELPTLVLCTCEGDTR